MTKYVLEYDNCETRKTYKFVRKNKKGETIQFELAKCKNWGGLNALPVLWKAHGYIDRVLDTYWSLQVYVTDKDNNCYGRYNPQHKLRDDGKGYVIDFDWMFEATEENKEKLIAELERRAFQEVK